MLTQFNTPVLTDGLLFGLSDKGVFFCINATDGKTAWTDTVKRGGNFRIARVLCKSQRFQRGTQYRPLLAQYGVVTGAD